MDDAGYLFERLTYACRGFCVHDSNNLRRFLFKGIGNLLGGKRLTPVDFYCRCIGAAPLCDIRHALAKHAINAYEHRITRLDEIHHASFHTGAACAGDGKRYFIFGLKGILK